MLNLSIAVWWMWLKNKTLSNLKTVLFSVCDNFGCFYVSSAPFGNGSSKRVTCFLSNWKKKLLSYSTVGCRRTVCRRTAGLEFQLKIRTTPGWKNELRTVSPRTNSVCLKMTSSAALLTSKRLHFDGLKHFSRIPRQAMRRRIPCARYKLTYVTRRRIER